MEFRQFAVNETSALAERLLAAATAEIEAATARVQAAAQAAAEKMRAEADQVKAALEKVRANEKTLQSNLEKMRAEEAALQSAVEKAHADQKSVQAALDKSLGEEKALQAALARSQADLKTLQATLDALRSEATKLRADESALRAQLQKEQEQTKAAQAQLAQALAANALTAAEHRKAQIAAERITSQKAALEKELSEARRIVESSREEGTGLVAELEAETAERAKVAALLVDAEKRLADASAERDAIADELKRSEALWLEQSRIVREQVARIAAAPLDQLRAAFQRLAGTRTVADALSVLIDVLASEFSRVALFHVNGNRLEGRQQTGFDFASDISKIVVPLARGSALTDAVRSGRVQGFTSGELTDSSRKLFGGTPTFVLILPVVIAGKIQAVLYADNSDQPQHVATTKRGVHFAEILMWHSVPLLARLSAEQRALVELRDYSRQLLNDLENVYESAVAAGQTGPKLHAHLQENLEYARSMYAQRIDSQGSLGAGLFDEQLGALIAAKRGVPFGRDLAAVSGLQAAGAKVSAEAS
jgi:chemotaxis protein histidine kinase CheA